MTPGFHSPYFTASHHAFRKEMRKFMDEVVVPDAEANDKLGKIPSQSVFDAMAKLGVMGMRLGPGPHLKGMTLMNGTVKPEEVRCIVFRRPYFSEGKPEHLSAVRLLPRDDPHVRDVRAFDSRVQRRWVQLSFSLSISQPTFTDVDSSFTSPVGLLGGLAIGLPALMNYGSAELKAKAMPDIMSGKKVRPFFSSTLLSSHPSSPPSPSHRTLTLSPPSLDQSRTRSSSR